MKNYPRNCPAFLLIFGVFVAFSASAVERLDRIAAIVGDQPILRSEVLQFKYELSSNATLANIYRVDASKLSFSDILNRMIEEKIIQSAAKEADVSVSDTEVETQIASIAKQNHITKNHLIEQLRTQGISFESYKKNIRAQIEKRNIFEREIRRNSGSTIPEAELRALYNQTAPREYKLAIYSLKKTKPNREKLAKIADEVRKGSLSLQKLSANPAVTSLDWNTADSLDKAFQKALMTTKMGQIAGPIDLRGQVHLLLYQADRRGSEEDFQKTKGDLQASAQGQDFDRRFALWVERKKKDMQIVVNEK